MIKPIHRRGGQRVSHNRIGNKAEFAGATSPPTSAGVKLGKAAIVIALLLTTTPAASAQTPYGFFTRDPYAPGRIMPGFRAPPVPPRIAQPCIPRPACLRHYGPRPAPVPPPEPAPGPAPGPAVFVPVAAPAPPPRAMLVHNGSLMELAALPGGLIEIRYVEPRPGLWEVGVRPGTALIRGRWNGPVLNAQAFVYSFCGPTPYPVSGGIGPGNVLTLTGPAPIVDPYSCGVLGLAWTGNSTLVFVPA
jgi:hypothetical protein